MTPFKRDIEVLVVGAGPVGLAAALALAQRNARVQILDEQPRASARSYALALHPRSLDLLSELGVAEELVALGHRVEAVAFYEGRERRAEVRLTAVDARHPFALAVPQQVLEDRLERRLAQRGVEVQWNHRLASLALNGLAQVTLERLARESAGYSIARTEWVVEKELTARAPYMVGADGHRSAVRRKLGIPFEVVGPPQLFAVFEFTAQAPPLAEARVALAGGKVTALWPLGGGTFRFSFEVDESEVALSPRQKSRLVVVLGESPFDYLRPELLERLLRERAPWFEGRVQEVAWSLALRFERRAAGQFGRRNVLLAGDAAHLAPPMACWSMNAGLEEAVDLAKRLDAVLHRGAPPESLEEYAQERQRSWRSLSAGQCRASGTADPWSTDHARAILEGLPALGRDLEPLLGQMGLALGGPP